MNQVGQVLKVTGTTLQGAHVANIANWWDGYKSVTSGTELFKVLNRGGVQTFRLTAVDEFARQSTQEGTITVNAPPVFERVSLSQNDLPASYTGTLYAVISDPEGGNITATFNGVSTSISSGGTALFPYTVSASKVINLYGTDVSGGVSRLPINVRVAPQPTIFVSGAADPVIGRIGTGQTITLSAFASEANAATITSITFQFTTGNGWSADATVPGTVVSLGDGAYNTSIVLSIASEVAGAKKVVVKVSTATGFREFDINLVLQANQNPVVNRLLFPANIGPGTQIAVSANVSDPDGDLVTTRWHFVESGSIITGNPVNFTPSGSLIKGSVVASDALGGQLSYAIPVIVITSDLSVEGVVSESFSYQTTVMGRAPITYTASGLPSGLTLDASTGIISGTPESFGRVEIVVMATNSDGATSETLVINVNEDPIPPTPPFNVRVNNQLSTTPTYTNGEDLLITWDIVNNVPTLDDPDVLIQFRDQSGIVLDSATVAAGTTTYTLTNSALQGLYGSETNVIIRLFAVRNSTQSEYHQQVTAVRV